MIIDFINKRMQNKGFLLHDVVLEPFTLAYPIAEFNESGKVLEGDYTISDFFYLENSYLFINEILLGATNKSGFEYAFPNTFPNILIASDFEIIKFRTSAEKLILNKDVQKPIYELCGNVNVFINNNIEGQKLPSYHFFSASGYKATPGRFTYDMAKNDTNI